MENTLWKKTTGNILLAFIVYSIAGSLASIFAGIGSIVEGISYFDFESFSYSINYWEFLGYVFYFMTAVGYVIFFTSINRFSKLQKNAEDTMAVKKVRNSYILLLIATITGFIPVIGLFIKWILMIVAYIIMLVGYIKLGKSQILHELSRKGAERLSTCAKLGLVATILCAIPVAGFIVENVMQIIIFILSIIAWGNIKNGTPAVDKNDAEIFTIREKTKDTRAITGLLMTHFFLGITGTVVSMMSDILPQVEVWDSATPFGTQLYLYTNIALFIYVIVFTIKRRGALPLTGAIIMLTVELLILTHSIYPVFLFFDTHNIADINLIFYIFDEVLSLLNLISYILLVIGMKTSNMFRIVVISSWSTSFILSTVLLIILASNDFYYTDESITLSSIMQIVYLVLGSIVITFSFIENAIATKKAKKEIEANGI